MLPWEGAHSAPTFQGPCLPRNPIPPISEAEIRVLPGRLDSAPSFFGSHSGGGQATCSGLSCGDRGDTSPCGPKVSCAWSGRWTGSPQVLDWGCDLRLTWEGGGAECLVLQPRGFQGSPSNPRRVTPGERDEARPLHHRAVSPAPSHSVCRKKSFRGEEGRGREGGEGRGARAGGRRATGGGGRGSPQMQEALAGRAERTGSKSPAADRRVQAPRTVGHLRPPPREPVCPGETAPGPGHQRGISPARSRRATLPSLPPGPRERGSPAFPPPNPTAPGPHSPQRHGGPGRGGGGVSAGRCAGLAARGRQAGTGTGPRPHPDISLPAAGGGAERGGGPGALTPSAPPVLRARRAPRPPRCGPASITPRFSEAEPEAAERAESPKVTRSDRGRLSRDFAPGMRFPLWSFPGVADPSGCVGTWTPSLHPQPPAAGAPGSGASPSGSIGLFLGGRQRQTRARDLLRTPGQPLRACALPPRGAPLHQGTACPPRSAAVFFHPSANISLKTLFVPKPLLICLCVCQARSS